MTETTTDATGSTRRVVSRAVLAAFFMGAGMLHLVKPASYMAIMPPWLPSPFLLVIVSGVCEFAGGAGLLVPRVRRAAGWGLIALLVAVFPANVQMLLNARAGHSSLVAQVILWGRLPLQALLIWWVWWAAVRQRGAGTIAARAQVHG